MSDKLNNTGESPVLEPLMPGEDPQPEPISQDRNHQNTEDKIAEIMAQAHIKRGKAELRESMMQSNTIVYLLVLLVLFILSMEFLPSFLVIPVIMSFLVIKVLLAMKKQDLDLKGAIKGNIVLVLLTGLFVFLAILNILDK
ncbi:hypothetical protein [Ruminococcus flavefaciens]|uniref:hypothetical protein n=1 Tax=Ruminococcus flavefaciens TaxID=1265 RepID=UPI00048EC809|nr:hypothetical protein [Ruminococcus flavefaciens]